jgi:hypothetical protein
MSLPIFKSSDNSVTLLQTGWSSLLNPVLLNPANSGIILKGIKLVIGNNAINTTLGRVLQGWSVVRQRSAASIYDNQDNNQNPSLTLLLVSDAAVTVDLEVF